MIPKYLRFFTLWLIVVLVIPIVMSQSGSEMPGQELRYLRSASENQMEHIQLSNGVYTSYLLPQRPSCWVISPDGSRMALSQMDPPTTLTIRDLRTSTILAEAAWQSTWRACSMAFLSNTIIEMAPSNFGASPDRYEITSNGLIAVDDRPPQPDPVPQLPQQLQLESIPEFVLPSPETGVFLYERCVGQIFVNGSQQCPEGVTATLYDATTQTIIAELPRSVSDISGYDIYGERLSGGQKAAWSSDGQYLAYAYAPENIYSQFDLRFWNRVTRTTFTPEFPNERIAYRTGLGWSPTGSRLLFWIRGRLGEDEATDNLETTRQAIILDVTSGNFVTADTPYEFSSFQNGRPVHWSPDGQSLVFVDGLKNLIYMDAQTGTTIQIDMNVERIFDWVIF